MECAAEEPELGVWDLFQGILGQGQHLDHDESMQTHSLESWNPFPALEPPGPWQGWDWLGLKVLPPQTSLGFWD